MNSESLLIQKVPVLQWLTEDSGHLIQLQLEEQMLKLHESGNKGMYTCPELTGVLTKCVFWLTLFIHLAHKSSIGV